MAFLLKRCGWMAAAALAAAPCVEAGPMKWQITVMDGFALRYRLAQQVEAVKAASGVAQHAESIWSMTGLPDTADSLAAVKHFVFETGKYTMAQLLDALKNDFEGGV